MLLFDLECCHFTFSSDSTQMIFYFTVEVLVKNLGMFYEVFKT